VTRIIKTVRAIHANAGVQWAYKRQLEDMLTEAHLDLSLMISAAWRESEPVLAVPASGIGPVMSYDAASRTTAAQKALQEWGRKWQGKFDKMSTTIAKRFAGKSFQATEMAMRDALKAAGFTVAFKPTRASMDAFKSTVAGNVGLIKNLQQQYYNAIQQNVWDSVRAGADMHTLSQQLQKSYGINTRRAALIARDQNNKAKATIEKTRRLQLGITQAVWQHSSGGKEPRPLHVAWGAERKRFDIAKGMYDEDERRFIQPGELINCRCTSRAVIPGLDE
jgi:uncharacterized protein with gpF-like domain